MSQNDNFKLLNEVSTVASIISPGIDEGKLVRRLEEILSNYNVNKKTVESIRDDTADTIQMFLIAKELEGLSPLTLEGYQRELSMFYNYVHKGVAQITTLDARRYLASNKEWSQGTVEKKLSVLKSLFTWLVDEEVLLKNPVNKIKPPRKPQRLPRSLTIEELEMVREACKTHRERMVVEVLFSSGLRLSEFANLKISDIDFSDKSATIIGKGNRERVVYFSTLAIYYIEKYLSDRQQSNNQNKDHLTTTSKRPHSPMSNRSIQRLIHKIASRIDLGRPLTPHMFRHTTATTMVNNGADLVDVQHILGHANPSTSMIYVQVSEERKKTAHRRFLAQ